MRGLLVIGSSAALKNWVAASSYLERTQLVICTTVSEALGHIRKGFIPQRVMLEGSSSDTKLLAGAALLQLCGCHAPVAFIEFAELSSSPPTIVCAMEQNRKILACQVSVPASSVQCSDAQVLFDYQAPCHAGRKKRDG